MRVKFGVLEQTQDLQLHAKFHLNVFIVPTSGGQKPPFWANFDIWGLQYRPPFTDQAKFGVLAQTRGIRVYLPNFVSIGLFCHPLLAKNTQFLLFFEFGIYWCRQLAAV